MLIKTLNQLDVTGKTVLVRVDFNVPIHKDGTIADDTRIKAHIGTIMELIERGAKVILTSHMGKSDASLKVVSEKLSEFIPCPITFVPECKGPIIDAIKNSLQEGEILLLENTRKYQEEVNNDDNFAKELAQGVDIYINDAFGAAHRKHASTHAITKFVMDKGMGRLMEREVKTLSRILDTPKKPLLVIIGGSKISSKIAVIRNLIHKADQIIIGGAMAHTFFVALGDSVGKSLYEIEMVNEAKAILQEAVTAGCRLTLPKDVVVAEELKKGVKSQTVDISKIPDGYLSLDIGEQTLNSWEKHIQNAGTILWNGPVGAFETPPFNLGTNAVAKFVSQSEAFSVVGGGDTLSALTQSGFEDKMSYISTAGGAMLEFLEGKKLPALKALAI